MNKEKIIKYLSLIGKGVGVVGSMNAIPGVSPTTGAIIFMIASCVKDVVNRALDFLDDGSVNGSNKSS